MIVALVANVVWILYALAEGTREAFCGHFKNSSKRECRFSMNMLFYIQRVLFAFITGTALVALTGWTSLFTLLCLFLMFSYFHNGTYYLTRNKLNENVYPKGWADEDTDLKSKPLLGLLRIHYSYLTSYKKRLILMIISIFGQILIYFI